MDFQKFEADIKNTISHYESEQRINKKDVVIIRNVLTQIHNSIALLLTSSPEEQDKALRAAKDIYARSNKMLWNAIHIDQNPRVKQLLRTTSDYLQSYTPPTQETTPMNPSEDVLLSLPQLVPEPYQYLQEEDWTLSIADTQSIIQTIPEIFHYQVSLYGLEDLSGLPEIYEKYERKVKKYIESKKTKDGYVFTKEYFEESEYLVAHMLKSLPKNTTQEHINNTYLCLLCTQSELISMLFGQPTIVISKKEENLTPARSIQEEIVLSPAEEVITKVQEEKSSSSVLAPKVKLDLEPLAEIPAIFEQDEQITEVESVIIAPEVPLIEEFIPEISESFSIPEENISQEAGEEIFEEILIVESDFDEDDFMNTKTPEAFEEEPTVPPVIENTINTVKLDIAQTIVMSGLEKIDQVYKSINLDKIPSHFEHLNEINNKLSGLKTKFYALVEKLTNLDRLGALRPVFKLIIDKKLGCLEDINIVKEASLKQDTLLRLVNFIHEQDDSEIITDFTDFELLADLATYAGYYAEFEDIKSQMESITAFYSKAKKDITSYEVLKHNNFSGIFHGVDIQSVIEHFAPEYVYILDIDTGAVTKLERLMKTISMLENTYTLKLSTECIQAINSRFNSDENNFEIHTATEADTVFANLKRIAAQLAIAENVPQHIAEPIIEEVPIIQIEIADEIIETPKEEEKEPKVSPLKNHRLKSVAEIKAEKAKEFKIPKYSSQEVKSRALDLGNELFLWHYNDLSGPLINSRPLLLQEKPLPLSRIQRLALIFIEATTTLQDGLLAINISELLMQVLKASGDHSKISWKNVSEWLKSISIQGDKNALLQIHVEPSTTRELQNLYMYRLTPLGKEIVAAYPEHFSLSEQSKLTLRILLKKHLDKVFSDARK